MHRLCVFLMVWGSVLLAQAPDGDPFVWQQRWDSYVERTFNWKRITGIAAETAFEQTFQLNKCGRPPYCFPHQFGGALARRTTRTTLELGVGALLHEDIRRRPSGLTTFRERALFAIKHAALAKGPDGEWRPAYSRYAGTFGSIVVYSAWTGRPMTAERLFGTFGWSTTNYFQDSLYNEFEPDIKRYAKRTMHRISPKRFPEDPLISAPAVSPTAANAATAAAIVPKDK